MIQIGASAATIDTPIEHLMACHRRIEQRLETLIDAAGHMVKDRTGAIEAIRKSFLSFWTLAACSTPKTKKKVCSRA